MSNEKQQDASSVDLKNKVAKMFREATVLRDHRGADIYLLGTSDEQMIKDVLDGEKFSGDFKELVAKMFPGSVPSYSRVGSEKGEDGQVRVMYTYNVASPKFKLSDEMEGNYTMRIVAVEESLQVAMQEIGDINGEADQDMEEKIKMRQASRNKSYEDERDVLEEITRKDLDERGCVVAKGHMKACAKLARNAVWLKYTGTDGAAHAFAALRTQPVEVGAYLDTRGKPSRFVQEALQDQEGDMKFGSHDKPTKVLYLPTSVSTEDVFRAYTAFRLTRELRELCNGAIEDHEMHETPGRLSNRRKLRAWDSDVEAVTGVQQNDPDKKLLSAWIKAYAAFRDGSMKRDYQLPDGAEALRSARKALQDATEAACLALDCTEGTVSDPISPATAAARGDAGSDEYEQDPAYELARGYAVKLKCMPILVRPDEQPDTRRVYLVGPVEPRDGHESNGGYNEVCKKFNDARRYEQGTEAVYHVAVEPREGGEGESVPFGALCIGHTNCAEATKAAQKAIDEVAQSAGGDRAIMSKVFRDAYVQAVAMSNIEDHRGQTNVGPTATAFYDANSRDETEHASPKCLIM